MKICIFLLIIQLNIMARTMPNMPEINFSLMQGFKRRPLDKYLDQQLFRDELIPVEKNIIPKIISSDDYKKLNPLLLFEGSGTRGGGSGIVQITQDFKIIDVWALDLYRGNHLLEFPTFFFQSQNWNNNPQNIDEEALSEIIIDQIISQITPTLPILAKDLTATRKKFNKTSWCDTQQRIPLIDDYVGDNKLTANEFQYQIAYRIHDTIVYDKFLYDKMDAINRAAIKVHEYLYAISNLTNSLIIQKLVSLIFSDQLQQQLNLIAAYKRNEIKMQKIKTAPLVSLLSKASRANFDILSLEHKMSKRLTPLHWYHACGTLEKFQFDTAQSELTINLQLFKGIDHLKIEQLLPADDSYLALIRSKKEILQLSFTSMEKINNFILGLFYTKSILRKQYPLYQYPSSITAKSVICYNTWTGSIIRIESAIFYSAAKNKKDLAYALGEVEYIKAVVTAKKWWHQLKKKEYSSTIEKTELKLKFDKANKKAQNIGLLLFYKRPQLYNNLLHQKQLELLGKETVQIK